MPLGEQPANEPGAPTTKRDIAKKTADETGLKQQLALQVVQLVLDGIIEPLATEGRVELRNFGVFAVHR
jgi:nucleoid DNA-binding protein